MPLRNRGQIFFEKVLYTTDRLMYSIVKAKGKPTRKELPVKNTIYATDRARKSHILNIERIIAKLNSSEDCMKGLGYQDLREVIRYLNDLEKATKRELFSEQ